MTDRCRHCVTRGLMCYGCRDNPERWNNPKLFERGEKDADGLMANHARRVERVNASQWFPCGRSGQRRVRVLPSVNASVSSISVPPAT